MSAYYRFLAVQWCSGGPVGPSAPVASAPSARRRNQIESIFILVPRAIAKSDREKQAWSVIIHPWKQATAGGPPADGAQREHIKAAVDVYEIYRRYLHRCNSQGIGKPLLNLYDAMTINYY